MEKLQYISLVSPVELGACLWQFKRQAWRLSQKMKIQQGHHFDLITQECCICCAGGFHAGPRPHFERGMVMTSSLNSLELMALLKLVFWKGKGQVPLRRTTLQQKRLAEKAHRSSLCTNFSRKKKGVFTGSTLGVCSGVLVEGESLVLNLGSAQGSNPTEALPLIFFL